MRYVIEDATPSKLLVINNARYGSGNDFTLDPDYTDDQALSNFRTAISRASISNAGFQQISPVATIVGLEVALGQGVQTTTQPKIEALLIVTGLDADTAAATANVVGQQLNITYAQAGEGFLQALANAGLPFHGVIPTEGAPRGGAAKLIFGYITRPK